MKFFRKKQETIITKEIKVDLTPELKTVLDFIDVKLNGYEKRLDLLEKKYDRLPQTEKPSEVIIPKVIDGKTRYFNSRGEDLTR